MEYKTFSLQLANIQALKLKAAKVPKSQEGYLVDSVHPVTGETLKVLILINELQVYAPAIAVGSILELAQAPFQKTRLSEIITEARYANPIFRDARITTVEDLLIYLQQDSKSDYKSKLENLRNMGPKGVLYVLHTLIEEKYLLLYQHQKEEDKVGMHVTQLSTDYLPFIRVILGKEEMLSVGFTARQTHAAWQNLINYKSKLKKIAETEW